MFCYARSEVPMAVKMLMLVFWVVIKYAFVGRYQHFGGAHSLHLQG
jgi:hypothetical protein